MPDSDTTPPVAPDAATLTETTFNLVPRAVEALDATVARRGTSKTDAINLAIQVFDFVTEQVAKGHGLAIVNDRGEVVERWRLLG